MQKLEPCKDEASLPNTGNELLNLVNKFMEMKVLQKINTIVDFRDMLKNKNSNEIYSSDALSYNVFKRVLIDNVYKVKYIPGIYDCYREFSLILDIIKEKGFFDVEYSEVEYMIEVCENVMNDIDYKLKAKTNKLKNLKNRIRKLKKCLNS